MITRGLPEERRETILSEIENRAPGYVPEWRYNLSPPDAGAALAFIWADMFTGTLERFDRLPDNYRRALLDTVGSEPRQPLPARGHLMFVPREEMSGLTSVPAGTRAAIPGQPQIALATDQDMIVSPAKLTAMYFVSPSRDLVRRYDSLENITLFRPAEPQPHIWTLTHPYAFDVSKDSSLRLELDTRGGTIGGVSWSFLDGEAWRPLEIRDEDGKLLLIFPEDKSAPCRQIRFTLHGGCETELYGIKAYPGGFALRPDALYFGDTQQSDTFYPFGQRFLTGQCFYAACSDALGKPGAAVEMSFDLNFEDFPIEGYPEPQIHWKKLMKESDFAPPVEYEISVSEVIWEYYNGIGWASLPVRDAYAAKMFADGRAGHCVLRFICPKDVSHVICGAHEALFIRARILKAENLFRMFGRYITPVISNLRFGYRYTSGVAVTEAKVCEHMDERRVTLASPTRLTGLLPSPCAVYFAFDRQFTQGTLMPLIAPSRHEPPPLRWEYFSVNGWTPLDIHDGTGGMSKTGIITYQTPFPCAETRLFGHDAHWMRLADVDNACERHNYTGPRLLKLHQNVVTATAVEPGEASNLPEGSFTSLLDPVPGVSEVVNPLPVSGGVCEEPEENIIRRVTASFSHGGRAISPADYEALALEASPRVKDARCYTDTDENGYYKRGSTCLVVMSGDSGETESLLSEVETYVSLRRPLGAGKIHAIEPRRTAVNVELQAAIKTPDKALAVKKLVLETLTLYFDPLNGGNGTGWPIGVLPAPDAVNAVLRAVSGVLWIYGLKVTYVCGMIPVSYERAVMEPFTVPADGEHSIILLG